MLDASCITFGDKKNNYVPTLIQDKYIMFTLGSSDAPLRAPFGVSEPLNGGQSDRKTLDLEIDGEEMLGKLKSIDATIVAEAIKRPTEFFGKRLSENEVRAMHQPLVTCKEDFKPTVRTKVKMAGKTPTVVRVAVGENKMRRGTVADITKDCKVMLHVGMSSVWFATKMFGVSLSVNSIVVWPTDSEDAADPFANLFTEV